MPAYIFYLKGISPFLQVISAFCSFCIFIAMLPILCFLYHLVYCIQTGPVIYDRVKIGSETSHCGEQSESSQRNRGQLGHIYTYIINKLQTEHHNTQQTAHANEFIDIYRDYIKKVVSFGRLCTQTACFRKGIRKIIFPLFDHYLFNAVKCL